MNSCEKQTIENVQSHLEQSLLSEDRDTEKYHVRESLQLIERLLEED